jgi:acetyl-CoA carboxylase, biotin carboxylase subunit
MRVVDHPGQMREACELAMSEAAKAFGDGRVYLERRLASPRHVEIQILADGQGNVVHLFERECSIQRRHQKIIEETPSPALSPELRQAMGQAAVAAARAAGYVNAGTVEFLLAPDGAFYFLEVNTRLQVEHPITEMTTGVDLVRCQLEIAAGLPLGLSQEQLVQRGHAIECRIYAEDPQAGFLPSPGLISCLREPAGPGVRNDCGVYQGVQVPMEYDPILSKLVVHARTREQARQRMLRALGDYVVLGIKTSIPYLADVLSHPEFIAGATSTDFLERHLADWRPRPEGADLARLAYVLADNLTIQAPPGAGQAQGWPTPWQTLGRWSA